jgi:hypothetical protein
MSAVTTTATVAHSPATHVAATTAASLCLRGANGEQYRCRAYQSCFLDHLHNWIFVCHCSSPDSILFRAGQSK